MALKLKGVEPKSLDLKDGSYSGTIKVVEENEPEGKDYKYLDVLIGLKDDKGKEIELRVGYPLSEGGIIPNSLLGQLVKRFTGSEVKVGLGYDLEEILMNSACQFLVAKDEKGYVKVMRETLKPVEKD